MVRLNDLRESTQRALLDLDCPDYGPTRPVEGPPLAERTVAIVSTAGIHRRGDRPFSWGARDFREIGRHERDMVISHVSVNFDRTGFQQDLNTIWPIDRLEELAAGGHIGDVAPLGYSFVGATSPTEMETAAAEAATAMRAAGVGAVLLAPV